MSDLTCDVAIIGAGTAGLSAERNARRAGASTLLIDPEFSGTTCANTGCMPSKLLIAAADAAHVARHAGAFGVQARPIVVGAAVMRRLRHERDAFAGGMRDAIGRIPDDIRVTARAAFRDPSTLILDDGRTVAAGAVVIATGARSAIPPGFEAVADRLLTNETLFELTDLPRSVAVIGAGPLGIEMGQALARLGVEVALFDTGETLAGLPDPAVSDRLHACLSREMDLHLGVEPQVARVEAGVRVSWNGQSREVERVLVAAGRPPCLEGLKLEAAGLELDAHGTPLFDRETLQCGSAPVFIAGDSNHDAPLLHEAAHEGVIAGTNAARHPDVTRFERHVAMAVTFCRPEAASIGTIPDPDDARFAAADADYADQGRATIEARAAGLARLYARRADGRLTGACLCTPGGEHLAHLLAWAIEARLTVSELLGLPYYHPTLEEGLKPALRALCAACNDTPDPSRTEDAPAA